MRALAKHEGVFVLHFLPPYSPEHNRIERLWRDLHANVTRNHRHRTIAALMDRVRYWLRRERDRRRKRPAEGRRAARHRRIAPPYLEGVLALLCWLKQLCEARRGPQEGLRGELLIAA